MDEVLQTSLEFGNPSPYGSTPTGVLNRIGGVGPGPEIQKTFYLAKIVYRGTTFIRVTTTFMSFFLELHPRPDPPSLPGAEGPVGKVGGRPREKDGRKVYMYLTVRSFFCLLSKTVNINT